MMAKQLNTLSKHGILVGLSGIVLLIVLIVKASMNLKRLVDEADDKTVAGKFVLRGCGFIVLYVIGISLCWLFILGIRKRKEWFMLPLLLVVFAGGVFVSSVTVYDATTVHYKYTDLVFVSTVVICLSLIVLYPLCMLFFEIRQENIEDRKRIQIKPARV